MCEALVAGGKPIVLLDKQVDAPVTAQYAQVVSVAEAVTFATYALSREGRE